MYEYEIVVYQTERTNRAGNRLVLRRPGPKILFVRADELGRIPFEKWPVRRIAHNSYGFRIYARLEGIAAL